MYVCVSLIAAAPQTVSAHTPCRYMTPWVLELASPDPVLRRSDSPPLSWAGDLEMEKAGERIIMMEEMGRGRWHGREVVSVVRK